MNFPRKAQHRDFTSLLKGRGAQVVHVRDLLIEVSHQGLPPLTLACRNPQILQLNPLKNSISRYVIVLRMYIYIYIYIYIHVAHCVCYLGPLPSRDIKLNWPWNRKRIGQQFNFCLLATGDCSFEGFPCLQPGGGQTRTMN